MAGSATAFTDREGELAAADRLVAAGSRQRLLAVYGVSGSGKTAFLQHVRERGARGTRSFRLTFRI